MQFLQNAFQNLNLQRLMSFYAVARGHQVGIYDTWSKCEEQVKGFKGAKYKKFPTLKAAESFLNAEGTIAASCSGTARYSPKDVSVALGKKTTSAQWQSETDVKEQPQPVKVPAAAGVDYWPESDGDSFDEDAITEAELVAALAELEEKKNQKSTSCSKFGSKTKRAATTDAAASAGLKSKRTKHASKVWEAVGQQRIGCYDFAVDVEDFVIVYTDGSCINNGQANAAAGFGVYFGDNHPLNAAKPVLGRVTNNVGEIQAAIYAIKVAKDVGIKKLCISTDSQFLINAITAWIYAWKRNKWCLKSGEPVKNVVDFMELDALLQSDSVHVKWNYVKAHKGIKGNEMADKLAREGSDIFKRLHAK